MQRRGLIRWLLGASQVMLAFVLLALAAPVRPVVAPAAGQPTRGLPVQLASAASGPAHRMGYRPLPASPHAPVGAVPTAAPSYNLYLPSVDTTTPPSLSDLSNEWILMVDDGYIAARDVARRYHPFQKYPGNPILTARKPWEGGIIQLYGTVFSGFRMWYSSYNQDWRYGQTLYAESDDGIQWRKPDLPNQAGNTLFGGRPAEIITVMHTPADYNQPYKLVVYHDNAFWGYSSPDGITMTPVSSEPLWRNGEDVAHFSWNAGDRRYYGTAKELITVDGVWRRAIRLLVSDDFAHWTPQPDLFAPDAQDDQNSPGFYTHFYGMPQFALGRQRLGLLWVLKARNTLGLHGPVHVQLASSDDGLQWRREEGSRPPVLDVGPPGAWDGGQVYTASQPVKVGSELWLYYSGCNLEHGEKAAGITCSIGLATLPYLRLASLGGSGAIVTRPLTASGSALRLNYAAPQGEIRVELQRDGAPIPGYEAENCLPLSGDSLEAAVAWKGRPALPSGPFQIKFLLQNAAIYAFAP